MHWKLLLLLWLLSTKKCVPIFGWTNDINATRCCCQLPPMHNSYNGQLTKKIKAQEANAFPWQHSVERRKKRIRWKSDIHLISKCKFKSPFYHPHIAHLFKLWCTTGCLAGWLVGWTTTTTQTMKKKWVANLLAAAIPHSRDSLQWWIAFHCLLLLLVVTSSCI